MSDSNVYTAEKILSKRQFRGVTQYLIKWKGYSRRESTWEPVENILDPELLTQFEKPKRRRQQPTEVVSDPGVDTKIVTKSEPSASPRHKTEPEQVSPIKNEPVAQSISSDSPQTQVSTPVRESSPSRVPTPARAPTPARIATPVREPTPAQEPTPTPTRTPTPARAPTPVRVPTPVRAPTPARVSTPTPISTPKKLSTQTQVSTPTQAPATTTRTPTQISVPATNNKLTNGLQISIAAPKHKKFALMNTVITDVTVNNQTITISESRTGHGFFKDAAKNSVDATTQF